MVVTGSTSSALACSGGGRQACSAVVGGQGCSEPASAAPETAVTAGRKGAPDSAGMQPCLRSARLCTDVAAYTLFVVSALHVTVSDARSLCRRSGGPMLRHSRICVPRRHHRSHQPRWVQPHRMLPISLSRPRPRRRSHHPPRRRRARLLQLMVCRRRRPCLPWQPPPSLLMREPHQWRCRRQWRCSRPARCPSLRAATLRRAVVAPCLRQPRRPMGPSASAKVQQRGELPCLRSPGPCKAVAGVIESSDQP